MALFRRGFIAPPFSRPCHLDTLHALDGCRAGCFAYVSHTPAPSSDLPSGCHCHPAMNTAFIPRFPRLVALSTVLGLTITASAPAALLVYEGFDGYAAGTRLDQYAPNANTIGLDTATTYYDGTGTRTANYTLQASSLTLGALQTNGGSLAFTAGTNVIGADIDIGPAAHEGTLWASYLVTLSSRGDANGNGAVVRVGNTPSDHNSGHFNSWADSRANSSTKNVSVGYGPAGSSQPDNGSDPLALNTTYIIISSFTNVGVALGTETPGVASLWALNEGQFAAFITAGGDEAALELISVTATATQTLESGTLTFSSADAIGLVTVQDAGVLDELRFGSTLADVTPLLIPEPAAVGVLAGLAALAFGLSRRRAASARRG